MKTRPSGWMRPGMQFLGMAVIVLFWLGFCSGWVLVMHNQSFTELRLRLLWLGGSACAYGLAMALWIWHCRRTARKPIVHSTKYVHDRDHLGRPVVVEYPATVDAKHLVVRISDGVKLYRLAELPAFDELGEHEVTLS